jgi:eukaryotic-like serine/threonine-protein kinase
MSKDASTGQLPSGANLGQYQVVEHIGAGGMDIVYEATDTKLGGSVALKLLRPEILDASGTARLEARVPPSLNHPRAGAIYDFEEHGGVRFFRWSMCLEPVTNS